MLTEWGSPSMILVSLCQEQDELIQATIKYTLKTSVKALCKVLREWVVNL